jgi:acyl-CoA reductase-like NAD-dependent aldehyde dehydrogenase
VTGSVEAALDRLAQRKDDWVRVDIPDRLDILRRCSEGLLAVGVEWVELACAAKGTAVAGEEWISGPMVTMRSLRLLRRALEAGGQRRPPGMSRRDGGQLVARVMPADLYDRLLFTGVGAEVWIEPGKPPSQGRVYREKIGGQYSSGRVALVLGAGNVGSIAATDVLHKLFVEDQVVILKMNPVNDYLGPLIESAFESLIEAGFLAVAYGRADVGSALCHDERVDTIHLTGSDRTHDAIVWGNVQEERDRRRTEGKPVLDKPFSSELGCVTPVLVVPGPWKPADLDFQARHVAAMVAHNASFNCNAAKVLVLARGWGLSDAFRDRVEARLSSIPQRYPYYPGARERYRAFLSHYPNARPLGEPDATGVPWTIIPEVPARGGEYALTHEAFCGVLAIVELEARGAAEFLERAVNFVNDDVWGTLACSILIDRRTARRHGVQLDRAVADLRYGGIGINAWAGVNFGLGSTSWGAFPGHTMEAIGSGRGTVHNAFLFDYPEKSVVRAPFRQFPKPVMFADHRTLDELGRKLTAFEATPSLARLPGILWSALRG